MQGEGLDGLLVFPEAFLCPVPPTRGLGLCPHPPPCSPQVTELGEGVADPPSPLQRGSHCQPLALNLVGPTGITSG